jgi:tetratricopeptide (TPR) repeat protein
MCCPSSSLQRIFSIRIWIWFAALVGNLMFAGFSTNNAFAQEQEQELLAEIQKAQAILAQQDFKGAEKMLRALAEKYPDRPGPKYFLGNALLGQKRYEEALAIFEKTKEFPRVKVYSLYNIACILAIQKKPDEAIASLEEAIKAGFTDFGQLQTDSDLASLKDDPRFQRLIPKLLSDEELFASFINGRAKRPEINSVGRLVALVIWMETRSWTLLRQLRLTTVVPAKFTSTRAKPVS